MPTKKFPYINAEDNIQQIIDKYPGIEIIFMGYGLHCANCIASGFDTLSQGAKLHGFDDEIIDMMLRDANTTVEEMLKNKTKS